MSQCQFRDCRETATYVVTVTYTYLGRPSVRPMCGPHARQIEYVITVGEVGYAKDVVLELLPEPEDGQS